jgi:membrane protein
MAGKPTTFSRATKRVTMLAQAFQARYKATRLGKTLRRFGGHNGNVLAAGIAYYSLASIAAGLMLTATVATSLVATREGWRSSFYDFLGNAIPGVVDSGDGEGLISEKDLSAGGIAGAVGAVSFIILLNTATRYVGGLRTGLRTMLGRASSNPLTGKLRDLIALVSLLVIALIGIALQVGASRAAESIVDGLDWESGQAWALRAAAGLAGLVADALFVTVALVVLGKARITRRLWLVVTVVAIAMSLLRFAVSASLAGTSSNPILAPFTAIITMLVFVDLVNRFLLLGAAWMGTYVTAPEEGADKIGADVATVTITNRSARYRDTKVTTARVTVRR